MIQGSAAQHRNTHRLPLALPDGRNICEEPESETLYNITALMNEFFQSVLKSHGRDREGRDIPLLIAQDPDNAKWQCVLGQPLRPFTDRFTYAPEEDGFQAIHEIVYSLHPLSADGEPGALQASIGDVLAISFKHWLTTTSKIQMKQGEAWKIADRNLCQFTTLRDFKTGPEKENVRANSRIPTFAYCHVILSFAADQQGHLEFEITKIWLNAFLSLNNPNPCFGEFAIKTTMEARKIGNEDLINRIVLSWLAVGVFILPPPVAPVLPHPHSDQLKFENASLT